MPLRVSVSTMAGPDFQALFDRMPPIVQQYCDPFIQKFQIPAYVKNPHKGLKKVCFEDGEVFPLHFSLKHLHLTLEDVVLAL